MIHTGEPGGPNTYSPYTWPWHNTPIAWLTATQAENRVKEILQDKPPSEHSTRLAAFQSVPPALAAEIPADAASLWAESGRLRAEGNRLWTECDRLWAEGDRLWAEGDRAWPLTQRLALAARVVPNVPVRNGELYFD